MTILSILQAASLELGVQSPSVVVTAPDNQTKQLLAFAHREGHELRTMINWPQLTKEFTFALVSNQDSYSFPADYDYPIFRTHWDRQFHWELRGPISPEEWQWRKSGVIFSSPRRRYRVKGNTNNQFFIDPVPVTADAGSIMVFEYQSKNWVSPVIWTTSTVFGANTYCAYNGNYYKTTAGGTTGATPPTHTTGSHSDGGVTWTYTLQAYDTFLADTDFSLLDENVVCLGTQWRFLSQKGLDYQETQTMWMNAKSRAASSLSSADTLHMAKRVNSMFITPAQVPDTGFGNA